MAPMKTFRPCEEVYSDLYENNNFGVVLLNSPTKVTNIKLWQIWNQAKIRVLVDGGSESWIAWNESVESKKYDLCLPHLVTGDFDSVSPETLEKFHQFQGVEVIHTPDQDETDFTKALVKLSEYKQEKNIENSGS